ncbi:unnamed protein product [Spirodela intermedia]|uniref:Uncharacterized protein n=1 Tax=Spirodela intermedia TaxID=51605 RepID=A0A7I8IJV5_SPIIN|nr:unnamed protein product [Spirodela intermedia]CAA6658165.1 unnamed protein product [Spirodela intermedia]
MRSRPPILRHFKMRLRGGLECHPHKKFRLSTKRLAKGKIRKIKAWLMTFSSLTSSWRRDYLEHIKIIVDQVSLDLRLKVRGLTPPMIIE